MIRLGTSADLAAASSVYRSASLSNAGDRDNLLAHPEYLRDPVLAEWGWEPEAPAPAVSVRAASALALEALSWRAHYPWQPVILLTYGYVLFAVARPVTRLTAPEAVGQQCV